MTHVGGLGLSKKSMKNTRIFLLNSCTLIEKQRFKWPARDDLCWVPFGKFVCKVDTPEISAERLYEITDKDFNNIMS